MKKRREREKKSYLFRLRDSAMCDRQEDKADHQKGMRQTGRTTKKADFPGGAKPSFRVSFVDHQEAIRGNKAAVKPHYAAI